MKSVRLEATVEIHNELSLKAFGGKSLIEVNHIAVVHLHEIHLHTFHAPVTVGIQDMLHIVPKRSP